MTRTVILALLSLLQFLGGFAWAVQRPQGFVLLMLLNAGLSEQAVGLVSFFGLVAPILGGPIIGLVADCLPLGKRCRVFALSVLLRCLMQLACWPALTVLDQGLRFYAVLASITLSQFWNTNGVLTEMTLHYTDKDCFGKVRLWGGVGFAMGSFLTGLIAHLFPDVGLNIIFIESLGVGFLSAIVALSIGCAKSEINADLASSLSTIVDESCHSTSSCSYLASDPNIARASLEAPRARNVCIFCKCHVVVFLLIIICLGMGEGTMQSFTYVRLQQLPEGTATIMGLSAIFMIISEVPFFYYSGPMMVRCGVMPILIAAFFCMVVRQAWIALLWDARLVLPGELLHGITFSIANAAVIMHVREIAPVDKQNTFQAMQDAAFGGIGMGGASWIGGLILQRYGVAKLFMLSAAMSLIGMLLPIGVGISARRKRITQART